MKLLICDNKVYRKYNNAYQLMQVLDFKSGYAKFNTNIPKELLGATLYINEEV